MSTPDPGAGIGPVLISARSYAEYLAMFDLTEADMAGRVLDCPGGAASFTAGALSRGIDATAVDPAYAHPSSGPTTAPAPSALTALGEHAVVEAERGNAFLRQHAHRLVWTWFTDPDDHLRQRTQAARDFCTSVRIHPTRYVPGALPHLPFSDASFDLVLSSHLLFAYGDRLDDAFHLTALTELIRVARTQVRVFPLVGHVDGRVHRTLGILREQLAAAGITTAVRATAGYEFQRGGNQMLVLQRRAPPDTGGSGIRPEGGVR